MSTETDFMQQPHIFGRLTLRPNPLSAEKPNLNRLWIDSLLQIPWTNTTVQGLEDLAKRYRLDVFVDTSQEGKTVLSLAGKIILVDVTILKEDPTKVNQVALIFADASGEQHTDEDLERCLRDAILHENTSAFERNIAFLAAGDHSSPSVQQSAFLYLQQIYKAVFAVHEDECRRMKMNDALLYGHGVPVLNKNDILGLQLTYWESLHETFEAHLILDDMPPRGVRHVEYAEGPLLNPQQPFLPNGDPQWVSSTAAEDTLTATLVLLLRDHRSLWLPLQGIQALLDKLQLTDVFLPWPETLYGELLHLPSRFTSSCAPLDGNVDVTLEGHDIPARQVYRVPIAHPRQILPVLHILRQYLVLQLLLTNCAGPTATSECNTALRISLTFTPMPCLKVRYQWLGSQSAEDVVTFLLFVQENGHLLIDSLVRGLQSCTDNAKTALHTLLTRTHHIPLSLQTWSSR
ncbi:mediator complex subunit Pmc2/Med1 [Schizosaccharomyces japonicus yFS275]|uniref:Mediator of RNA polymerase II transcription subunit 1 n=1 Tax=Schizosaccharomyces japonicus (strain yFS275 / FY16936) TaxID=402676 RepID=B6K2C3_SCHJY|nr:mediator complex subunit Pmc2/Med1 [Schizosaccharomyces japonicus yFS275]EEB07304.2 mediator complex subunit Pmc2/Med1 [Schizosaccharomyces japonicus yFS275]